MAQLGRFRRRTPETGAELIELALILPILLLVIAAIMDFGFLFLRYEVLTNAAREGARVGVLPGYQVVDVQGRVANYLVAGGLTAAAPAAAVVYGAEQLTPGGLTIGVVTVSVQYPSQFLFLGPLASLVGGGAYATITLNASSTMRRELAAGGP